MTLDTLDKKLTILKMLLARIERDFAPVSLASSFGAEDVVLIDLIAKHFPRIDIFTLETGRLPRETLNLMAEIRARYDVTITEYEPNETAVLHYVNTRGLNAFYDSVEARKACCNIRKVIPLAQALEGKRAWVTGLRREQAASRQDVAIEDIDKTHNITKFNPLADWSNDDVWTYIRANNVPYNALHDRGYPSIGCEPCTRAVKPGEDSRAGRWWWENSDAKECGLHVGSPVGQHETGSAENFSPINTKSLA
jgi:phosphoadenosine phosphosulfate reductase